MTSKLKSIIEILYTYLTCIYQFVKVSIRKKYSLKTMRKILSNSYKEHIGKELDWNNLNTYTEKMQWDKIYNDDPLKSLLSDKYNVRNWVKDKIGEEYLIPIIGVWDHVNEINFSTLPNKYVLKVTNGSGTNIIVNDSSNININLIKAKLRKWMLVDKSILTGFELHYGTIKPRIIAETYVEHSGDDLPDYKFLCFNGVIKYCWVDIDRYHNHKRNIYDLNWNLQPWNQYTYGNSEEEIAKPKNFDQMISIVKKLSAGFPQVRVDLYNDNGKIYFGEMTFTNGSGFEPIIPEEFDYVLGEMWQGEFNISD